MQDCDLDIDDPDAYKEEELGFDKDREDWDDDGFVYTQLLEEAKATQPQPSNNLGIETELIGKSVYDAAMGKDHLIPGS